MNKWPHVSAEQLLASCPSRITFGNWDEQWQEVRRRLEAYEAALWTISRGIEWQAAGEARIALGMIQRKRTKPRRVSVARDPKYLEFLREYGRCSPCLQDWPTARHHARIDPAHGPVNGMGSKGSDLEAIPLCRIHHEEQTSRGWETFCKVYAINLEGIRAYWNQQYKEMTNDESSQ